MIRKITPDNSPPLSTHERRRLFGDKVRRAMTAKGWYQSELARVSGLHRDQVSKYIRGQTLPNAEALTKLASALSVSPSDLLPDRSNPTSGGSTELKTLPGNPRFVWLHIDRAVPIGLALKVVDMIEAAEDANANDN